MKTYTIIAGVNGVGKSSFTGVLKEVVYDLSVIIDVDKIIAEHSGNTTAGAKAALMMIRECISKNISFTQETTLSGYRTEATAKQVKELGYSIRMFYIGLDSLEESLSRIQNRVKRGGHNIPKDIVSHRFSTRWDAIKKVLPYCDEVVFFDNDNGFVKVAEYRNGEFQVVAKHVPNWCLALQNQLKP